jgi:hypothetical protein
MKKVLIAAIAVAGFAAPAFAQPLNTHSNSQGSNVGRASSAVTGNGAVIGGGTNGGGQTTSPGSRAAAVQNLQAKEGRGSINSAKPGK